MATSLLITGGNLEKRQKKALAQAAENSSQFDTFVVDTTQEHGIAVVKEVINQISRKPFNSQLSTVLILEADKLTLEAQNALLKILEEPPEKAQIVLTAASKESLLPTVKSRLSEIDLGWERVESKEKENLESFSDKLDYFDKVKIDALLNKSHQKLLTFLKEEGNQAGKIKTQQRYLKLLLKMHKAGSLNINKKLISLILTLETPQES